MTGEKTINGWKYRKSHIIYGSIDGVLTNYVIEILVNFGSGIDSGSEVYCGGDCKTDFTDIRFTDSNGQTLLNQYMEKYTLGVSANFFIKIPVIPTDWTAIFMYYGNSEAVSVSNMSGVFLFGDDMENYANGTPVGGNYGVPAPPWAVNECFTAYSGSAPQLNNWARGVSYYADYDGYEELYTPSITRTKKSIVHFYARGFSSYGFYIYLREGGQYRRILYHNRNDSHLYFRVEGDSQRTWNAVLENNVWVEFKFIIYTNGSNSYVEGWANGSFMGRMNVTLGTAPIACVLEFSVTKLDLDEVYVRNSTDNEPLQDMWGPRQFVPKWIISTPYEFVLEDVDFQIIYGNGSPVKQVEIDRQYNPCINYTPVENDYQPLVVPPGEITEYDDGPIALIGGFFYRFRSMSYSDLYSDYYYTTVDYPIPSLDSLTASIYRNGIKLDWMYDEFGHLSKYIHIYRKSDKGYYTLIQTISGSNLSWIDYDRSEDGSYQYALRIENYGGVQSKLFFVDIYSDSIVPQIELSGRGGFNALRHSIYTFHDDSDEYKNELDIKLWDTSETDAAKDPSATNPDIKLHGSREIESKNIEPFENDIFVIGSELNAWKRIYSETSKTDKNTSARIRLKNGR